MKALVITADGKKEYVEPRGAKFTLEEMQKLVGGYIEKVGEYEQFIAYGDEDGRPKRLALNMVASAMLMHDVVGDIVFCPKQLFTF